MVSLVEYITPNSVLVVCCDMDCGELSLSLFFVVHARCRVKVALHHTYIALCTGSVVQHLHDVCTVQIRWNSVHGCLKLLVV